MTLVSKSYRNLAKDLSPKTVLQVFIASRAAILIVSLVILATREVSLADIYSHWDVAHYSFIAEHGYEANLKEIAFFPGLPALLKAGNLIGLPIPLVGALLALIGSALATWALYRLGGGTAASLWLIAPTAVFTTVGYTEALFCAATFWAWERAKKGHWCQAALLCGASCTLRVSGLFLLGALALLAMTDNFRGSSDRLAIIFSRLVWLLIPLAVLGLYVIYLHRLTGSWTAWFSAQQTGWSRDWVWPWESIANTIDACSTTYWASRPLVAWVFRAELVSWTIGLLTTIICFVRKHWAEGAWVGIQVLAFSITFWLMSINRAVLLWFPVFVGLGIAVRWRPAKETPRLLWAAVVSFLVVVSFALMIGWSWLYFTGQWAS